MLSGSTTHDGSQSSKEQRSSNTYNQPPCSRGKRDVDMLDAPNCCCESASSPAFANLTPQCPSTSMEKMENMFNSINCTAAAQNLQAGHVCVHLAMIKCVVLVHRCSARRLLGRSTNQHSIPPDSALDLRADPALRT